MAEQVPLAAVDVDAGVAAKFRDLVVDVGVSVLRVLLMGHAMEKKYVDLEGNHKDVVEDVEKWKHKATGLEVRLKEALKEKSAVEKEKKAAEEEMESLKEAKEAAETERDSLKTRVGELEGELAKATVAVEEGKGALALYFESGFKRATEHVLHFNPDAKVDELNSFKIVVNGELVDEE